MQRRQELRIHRWHRSLLAGPAVGLIGFLFGHVAARPTGARANCPLMVTYTPVAATVDGVAVDVPGAHDPARLTPGVNDFQFASWTPTGGAQNTFSWAMP